LVLLGLLFFLGLFASDGIHAQDSLVNVVQWKVSDGGNDHWYAVYARRKFEMDAIVIASKLWKNGMQGHLATITSAAENEFVRDHVVSDIFQPESSGNQFFLGARDMNGGWTWITNEPFAYSNWELGEPNNLGKERALTMWGKEPENTWTNPGTWNNTYEHDVSGIYGSPAFFSVIEWGEYDNSLPDSISFARLVQWPKANGGNDHWYAVLPYAQEWNVHDSLAKTLTVAGERGYLATITSVEEAGFLLSTLLNGLRANTPEDLLHIGGVLRDGLFQWVTGEAFIYTDWDRGPTDGTEEPMGNGNTIGLRSLMSRWPGKWDDVPSDESLFQEALPLWSIVEFGESSSGPRWDSLYVKLCQWKTEEGGNGNWYALVPKVVGFDIHQKVAPTQRFSGKGATLATITSADENAFIVSNLVRGTQFKGDKLQFYMGGFFHLPGFYWIWLNGEDWTYSHWAPGEPSNSRDERAMAMLGDNPEWPSGLGFWCDSRADDRTSTAARGWAIVEWDFQYVCGDVNGDYLVSVDDLLYLTAYYFTYGPPPAELTAGDLNSDGQVNIADISMLAAYLSGQSAAPCTGSGSTDNRKKHPKGGFPSGAQESQSPE
jgi:hypothetical protein